jgi:hypothetical protein
MDQESGWATDEFGSASLGNRARVRRLVAVARGCAQRPAGKITQVFSNGADREGTYRFLESKHVDAEAMLGAAHQAGATRCAKQRFVYVPIDMTSLNFTDTEDSKSLGMVGTRERHGHGFEVMTALAVSSDGTPQGIIGQKYWTRSRAPRPSKKQLKRRPTKEKETQHWLDVMAQARANLALHAPSTKPWFQLDRAGDAWPLLVAGGRDEGCWFTTRAAWDRNVYAVGDKQLHVWDSVLESEPLGSYVIDVETSRHRSARRVVMQLRAVQVMLDLEDVGTNERIAQNMWAVLASEDGSPPVGEKPLEWMLLTSFPVDGLESAGRVVLGYTQRWRVEEFHKAWKTGACNVEDSQLRDADHLLPWVIILASVAVRILRMTYFARAHPNTSAAVEFTEREIRAVATLSKSKGLARGATPTMKQMTTWIAQLGGYIGTSSGGPPGALVIARGLDRLQLAFQLLGAVDET